MSGVVVSDTTRPFTARSEASICACVGEPGTVMSQAFATRRSLPSEGLFCTLSASAPASRETTVVLPPPSRLPAHTAPSFTMRSAVSVRLKPAEAEERPSTATRKISPSLRMPIAVRGARVAEASLHTFAPLFTSTMCRPIAWSSCGHMRSKSAAEPPSRLPSFP